MEFSKLFLSPSLLRQVTRQSIPLGMHHIGNGNSVHYGGSNMSMGGEHETSSPPPPQSYSAAPDVPTTNTLDSESSSVLSSSSSSSIGSGGVVGSSRPLLLNMVDEKLLDDESSSTSTQPSPLPFGTDEVDLDYYQLLGVSNNSTEQQIRKAYRKLARQIHPDHHAHNVHSKSTLVSTSSLSGRPATLDSHTHKDHERKQQQQSIQRCRPKWSKEFAQQQMSFLNEIYSTLSNPERRRKYDTQRRRQNAIDTRGRSSSSSSSSSSSTTTTTSSSSPLSSSLSVTSSHVATSSGSTNSVATILESMMVRTLGMSSVKTPRHNPLHKGTHSSKNEGDPQHDEIGRANRDIEHTVRVTLEDLYCGRRKKFKIQRNVLCNRCHGCGREDTGNLQAELGIVDVEMVEQSCAVCGGSGTRTIQFGNMSSISLSTNRSSTAARPSLGSTSSMVIHRRPVRRTTSCLHCNGTGSIVKRYRPKTAAVCRKCNGNRTVQETNVVRLDIKPGTPSGHRYVHRGQGDEDYFSTSPGDLIFCVEQQEHPRFKRCGPNLHYNHVISAQEAAHGFNFNLYHLDGRILHIVSRGGIIRRLQAHQINSGTVHTVKNEGMPIWDGSNSIQQRRRGDLFIHFAVSG